MTSRRLMYVLVFVLEILGLMAVVALDLPFAGMFVGFLAVFAAGSVGYRLIRRQAQS